MYNRKAFKQEAKQLMRTSVPHFMVVALVYYLLTSGLSYAVSCLSAGGVFQSPMGGLIGSLTTFLSILVALFGIVMGAGFCSYAIRLTRREETGLGSLFYAFSFSGRALGLALMVALLTYLWTLLIVGGIGVVMALGTVLLAGSGMYIGYVVLVVVLCIAAVIAAFVITLRYSMATFALVDDPDAGVMEAIRRSIRMMRGFKGKFFALELSFLGWDILVWLINFVVVCVGVVASGSLELFTGMAYPDTFVPEAYYGVWQLMSQLTPWLLLAEVASLPLSLWLMVYRQTAYARFYNYVGGYDYYLYMRDKNAREERGPAIPLARPAAQPEQSAAEPEQPAQPPAGGYYTPAPTLEETEPEPDTSDDEEI